MFLNLNPQPSTFKPLHALCACGWATALAQIVLYREIMASAGGTELVLGAFLAGYLTWIAVGAALERKLPARLSAVWLLVAGAAFSVAEAAVARYAGGTLHLLRIVGLSDWQPGQLPPLFWSIGCGYFISLPSGACYGALFPRAIEEAAAETAVYAKAYAAESIGYVAAAMAGTSLLLWGAGNVLLLALCLAAVLPLLARWWPRLLCGFCCVLLALSAKRLELASARRAGFIIEPVAAVGHSYVRSLAVSAGASRTLYADCRPAGQYPQPHGAYTWLQLAAALAESTGTALVVAEDVSAAHVLIEAGCKRVVLLAPDRLGLRMLVGEQVEEVLAAAGVTVLPGDPVRRLADVSGVDLAYVGAPGPLSLHEARYFSAGLHGRLRRALSPVGVVVVPLEVPPNYRGEAAWRLLSGAWNALRAQYPYCGAFTAEDTVYMVASGKPLQFDAVAGRLQGRAGAPAAASALADYFLQSERTGELNAALAQAPPGPADAVGVFMSRLALEEEMYHPGRRPRLLWLLHNGRWLLLLAGCLLAAGVAAAVLSGNTRAATCLDAAAVGFAGMAGELVVVLCYQTARGMVYVMGGLLVAFFMLGFFTGARLASNSGPRLQWTSRLAAWLPLIGLAGTLAYSLSPVTHTLAADLLPVLILLVLGAGCGLNLSSLPARIERLAGSRASAAAWISAFDHIGGAIGGIAVALLLVPVLGMVGSAGCVLACKAVTAVGLLAIRAR